MERRLAAVTVTVSLCLSAVMAGPVDDKYCLTKECVTAAAEILNRMDRKVDPCHDFYNFACGGYIENNVIPDDKSRSSMFSELSDKLQEQVSRVGRSLQSSNVRCSSR